MTLPLQLKSSQLADVVGQPVKVGERFPENSLNNSPVSSDSTPVLTAIYCTFPRLCSTTLTASAREKSRQRRNELDAKQSNSALTSGHVTGRASNCNKKPERDYSRALARKTVAATGELVILLNSNAGRYCLRQNNAYRWHSRE
jgi:hypothetical protein